MKFDEYLKSKKIDPEKFKLGDQNKYADLEHFFNQIHPTSFTQQKLFLINKIRRNYQLKEQLETKKTVTSKAIKPKIRPLKPKTS